MIATRAGSAAVLSAEGISKRFGTVQALDHVSIALDPGAFVVLLGPNGAGKSTLFQMLSGLYVGEGGRIVIAGHDLAHDPVAALAALGIVFQQPTLDLDATVEQNLRFGARLHGLSGAAGRARIATVLGQMGLTDRGRAAVRTLSGGMRRRVEVARALVHQPKVLLMDEATVGLDPESRRTLLREVDRLRREQGVAVLWATHLVDEAATSDRVVILHRGAVLADAPAADILGASGHEDLSEAFLAMTNSEGPPP
jgi:ABC-2 type transport system ATP-binding protein